MSTFISSDKYSLFDVSDIQYSILKNYTKCRCKAVDMAPQPIRCLWSGDNKNDIKKNKNIYYLLESSTFSYVL